MFEKQIGILKSLKYETFAIFCVLMVFGRIKDPAVSGAFNLSVFVIIFGICLWIGYKSKKKPSLTLTDACMSGALVVFVASMSVWVVTGLIVMVDIFLGTSVFIANTPNIEKTFTSNPILGIFILIFTYGILVVISLLFAIMNAVGSGIGYFISGILLPSDEKLHGKKKIE